jgi:hypothetical protein
MPPARRSISRGSGRVSRIAVPCCGFSDPSGKPLEHRRARVRRGSRVVRTCVDRLKQAWQQAPGHTTANFIHEMLHTLGPGENPPSSAEITSWVRAACFRRR